MTRFRGWVEPAVAVGAVGLLVALFALPALVGPVPASSVGSESAETAPPTVAPADDEPGMAKVASAKGAALEVLTKESSSNCIEMADISVAVPRNMGDVIDAAIASAKVAGSGWVKEGMWLGDRASAAKAFGATAGFVDGDGETWIVTTGTNGEAIARQLVPLTSTSGKMVWVTRNQARECTRDPMVDEENEAPVYPSP